MEDIISFGDKYLLRFIVLNTYNAVGNQSSLLPENHHITRPNSRAAMTGQHLIARLNERLHTTARNGDEMFSANLFPNLQSRLQNMVGRRCLVGFQDTYLFSLYLIDLLRNKVKKKDKDQGW